MASSSASETNPQAKKYDVLISFRGEETRNNFTSHLYAALCRRKIPTFIDNQLIKGDEVSSSLLGTGKVSKVSLIIFSKDYSSSRWCLQELEWILGFKRESEQIVILVFYLVDPSDVRNQTGSFGDAFANLQEDFKERLEEMMEAAGLASYYHINGKSPESGHIEEIVEDILIRLNKLYPRDNKELVGVKCAIQEIESLFRIGSNDFSIVGIWGIGGIGKTTLCRAIDNKILGNYEDSFFVENVREESEKNNLSDLRKRLLFPLLGDTKLTDLESTLTGGRLKHTKAIIVFDDVTSSGQIEKLIMNVNYLGPGSQIIITTSDKHVLISCGVDDANVYLVRGLSYYAALKLSSKNVFKEKPS